MEVMRREWNGSAGLMQPPASRGGNLGRIGALSQRQSTREEPVLMPFVQPPLPYDRSALEPHMSSETMGFHYDKHDRGYCDTLGALTEGTPWADKPLPQVVLEASRQPALRKIFENAAQAWNHAFFWASMTPGGGLRYGSEMHGRLVSEFASVDHFNGIFMDAAAKHFGSGWIWLVQEAGKLKVIATDNAMPPQVLGMRPLLVCDVWEHAYYLDHRNDRGAFVRSFLVNLADWDTALSRLTAQDFGTG